MRVGELERFVDNTTHESDPQKRPEGKKGKLCYGVRSLVRPTKERGVTFGRGKEEKNRKGESKVHSQLPEGRPRRVADLTSISSGRSLLWLASLRWRSGAAGVG